MRKIIAIICFIMLTTPLMAVEDWSVTAGLSMSNYNKTCRSSETFPQDEAAMNGRAFYSGQIDLALKWRWSNWKIFKYYHHEIYYSATTYFYKNGGSFKKHIPYRDIYVTGTRIWISAFYVEYEHYCNHPVYSSQIDREWLGNKWVSMQDRVTVGFKYTFKGEQ